MVEYGLDTGYMELIQNIFPRYSKSGESYLVRFPCKGEL